MQSTTVGLRVRQAIGLAALALAGAAPLGAQEVRTVTPGVFRRYADHVVKIQVVETGSAAKASMGSGFFVSDGGHIVTNYHVISELVHDPERHRIEMVDITGAVQQVEVLTIDVVHDLAVLRAPVRPRSHFVLGSGTASQGDRLYSLGHPNDLGLSIVEGTYNGMLRHTLYPKIHFTGSINSGMSGGPTITEDGRVIGVNVATSGDQVSFLVPVDRATALVSAVLAPGHRPPASLLQEAGRQIRAYQDVYLKDLFAGPSKTVDLGRYQVMTAPAPFFRCWGSSQRDQEQFYVSTQHWCFTDDYLFIAGDQESGVVALNHELVEARSLNPYRFFALYTSVFQRDNTPAGQEEHVTSWRCATRNLRSATTPMRTVLCLRRYQKFDELYDAVLKVAVLGDGNSGLVSTLTLSGVTFESIDRLTSRYLERITWR